MLWPWQFYLAGQDGEEPSLVTLGLRPAQYLTLFGSIDGGTCRTEAWRYLIAGVEAIRAANRCGEMAEGEWGTTHLRRD